jgi:hypothetical protein
MRTAAITLLLLLFAAPAHGQQMEVVGSASSLLAPQEARTAYSPGGSAGTRFVLSDRQIRATTFASVGYQARGSGLFSASLRAAIEGHVGRWRIGSGIGGALYAELGDADVGGRDMQPVYSQYVLRDIGRWAVGATFTTTLTSNQASMLGLTVSRRL